MTGKRAFLRRILALMAAAALLAAGIPLAGAAETGTAEAGSYVLEAAALDAFDAAARADGDSTPAGTDNFFTILWSAKSKVDGSNKTWEEDGYQSAQRINFGGKAELTKNAVQFRTDGPATVKIWWAQGGDDNRPMVILDSEGETAASAAGTFTKNSPYLNELALEEAGTYYLGGGTGNNYLFKVEVATGGGERPERAPWENVPDPVIDSIAPHETDPAQVAVTVLADVGYDGADKVSVVMSGSDSAELDSRSSAAEKTEHTLYFTPPASGSYTFAVTAFRGEDVEHPGNTLSFDFTLPLGKPLFKSASNLGGGSVALEWEAVAEAEQYRVTVGDRELFTTDCALTIQNLESGSECAFTVAAVRGEETGPADEISLTVTEEKEIAWGFSAFGTGVTQANNGYKGNANSGSVQVFSTGGKGKLVPNSTDGLAFYYTKVDPNTTNFKLSATATVNAWTYSNGQEGFGLMAADAVGKNYDSDTFWNNSYMASVTKVEYNWDGEKVSDSGVKISMKLGVGSQEKSGVRAENITEGLTLEDMSVYSSVMTTLETSCAEKGAGTYNLVGNATKDPGGTVENPLTSFPLTIEKNNTGYFVSYTGPDGTVTTKKYYHPEALNYLDPDFVYVGFFASRNADITFENITFTTSDPATDPPAEDQPLSQVTPSYRILSAAITNSSDYDLVYYGNADGALRILDADETPVYDNPVTAGEQVRIPVRLNAGENVFSVTMTPDPQYRPSAFEELSSYEAVSFTHKVVWEVNTEPVVYVGPRAAADGAGTRENPADLRTAIRTASPGQQIILLEGAYALTSPLTIERGVNGTAEQAIELLADPDASSRPVLDFSGKSAGVILAASYWHLKGFDVTGTSNGQKGIQVSGSHNTLELLETYRNGNTGIQISRYLDTDPRDAWPADNLILNCTSYLNADAGYEDADGFAAKLTIGEGNVFDGCISFYNADDGWDLYAKIETGPIGKVVIQNSIAFKNGYLLDENGGEINAGNGNGFKMGGENMTGRHTLINSAAFGNKAKGIDSNSCPDIQVQSSTSFDNESYNIAFYTNTAVNTDFSADGILSYKKSNTVPEDFKLKGTQDEAKIRGENNYYFENGKSSNSAGTEVQDDWFVSLDMDRAIQGGITRNADGSINLGDFLAPTGKVPAGVGARLGSGSTEPGQPGTSEETYQVTFDSMGGSNVPGQEVKSGETVKEPTPPIKEKYRFEAWYPDTAFTAPYDFTAPVTGDMTLFARWTEDASGGGTGSTTTPGRCYVATAVYGSYDCPEVWTLRRFRDNALAKTWYGRLFIHLYYAVSPTVVRLFGHTEWFRNFWRARLDRMVANLQADGFASTPYQDRAW